MKRLIKHLQYLIRHNDSVDIPTFGSLKAVELPAFVSPTGDVMLPPTRKIYFEADECEGTNEILLESFLRYYKTSKENASSIMVESINNFKNYLSTHGMLIAGRLGTFYQKDSSIEFKANVNPSAYNPYMIFGLLNKKEDVISERVSKPWNVARKAVALMSTAITFASASVLNLI